MASVNFDQIIRWEAFILQAASLGVKSWVVIHAALQDSGADDAIIAALQPKWIALNADIRRAAGL